MSLYGNSNVTPELHSLSVTQSIAGICIPIMFGTNRVTQNLLGYWDFTDAQPYQSGGKGLGKSGNAYEYFAAVLGTLCQGVALAVLNVYSQNGRLTLSSISEPYTVPSGGGSYTVANQSRYAADAGVSAETTFSVTANDYGSPGPVTMTGTYQVSQNPVSGSPGAGEYSQSNGTYTFPASSGGQSLTITYSFSLYTLTSTEDDIIPNSSPYEVTVTYAPQWYKDQGVINVATGVAFTVGGGPGQYTTSNGNYFFNPADANTAVAISYEWQQSNSNVDPASQFNFTLIEGEQGQAPWTYLTSKHASQAFGYSTLVCIGAEKMDLGESATLPNYNFEVMMQLNFGGGVLDAPVDQCILAMLLDPHFGAGFNGNIDSSLNTVAADYWNSNGFFISPVINSSQTCSTIIENWLEAGNCGVYWSEGLLKFAPYGDTTTIGNGYVYVPQTAPVVDLDDDDFLAAQDEDPVAIDRTPWPYNSVKVQFANRLNAYNAGIVQETDDYAISLYGPRPEAQKDYDFLCTATAATFSANIRIKRLVYIRSKYTFKISALRYCFLEPMDLVTLTDVNLGLNKTPVRIISIEENEDTYEMDITAEEFPWGTATATLYPKQPALPPPPPPAMADPGNTNVVSIFEPTTRVATTLANSGFQIWLALNGGPNWGGCNVWLSKDGNTYQQIGTQSGVSRCGSITADLPVWTDPDTTNTLSVATSGQLFNVTVQQANALSTLCKVGTEYLSYADATITGNDGQGTNFYNLNYLRRGAFSSPDIAHSHTDPDENGFIRLDSQIFQYSFDPSLAGQTIYFKFTSFNLLQNQVQQLADVQAYPYVVSGINLSANMTVDSVLDISGITATIRIYQTGQPVGTSGSAELPNGALIILPADSISGQALATEFYINFNPITSSYVEYTDQNQWLLEEITLGYIRIGSVMTPSDFAFIPLLGGGTIAIGAGQGAYGASIPIPSGYNYSDMVAFVTPRSGFNNSTQMNGVYNSTQSSGVLQSNFSNRSNASAQTASSNWVVACWTTGAAVTVTSSGGMNYVSLTTAAGDDLCIASGTIHAGSAVSVPPGFTASQFINICGMASTDSTGNGMQGVQYCSLDPSLRLSAQYNDNNGHTWGANANIFGIFWNAGGGVTSQGVTGGTAIIIPLIGTSKISLVQAFVNNGGSFGVPFAFAGASIVSAAAMATWTPSSSNVAHGWPDCETTGFVFTGRYMDGSGNSWAGGGNILAIASL